jgi:nitroreductase
MDTLYQIICERRTIRRFKNKPIAKDILMQLVNAGRLAPSGANIQPCEYIIIHDDTLKEAVFPLLKWAAYIAPHGNPSEDERPVAYIMVLIDLNKKKMNGEVDAAAAIQNILLAAWSEGISSCWLGSINRNKLKKIFNVPDHIAVNSVIALGYANEKSVLEESQDSIRYWKDDDGILHVPKRKFTDIVHINKYGNKI